MTKKTICSWMFSIITLCTVTAAIVLLMPFSAFAEEGKCRFISSQLVKQKFKSFFYGNYTKFPFAGGTQRMIGEANLQYSNCAARGGVASACQDVRRTAVESSQYPTYENSFGLNHQTCNIEGDGKVLDAEADAPIDPLQEALWKSQYKYLEWFQGRCESYNDGRNRYGNDDPPSPWKNKFESNNDDDKKWVARQLVRAHEDAVKPLEDYLRKNCFQDEIKMKFNGMQSSCSEPGKSSITVSTVLPAVATVLDTRISGPNTTGITPNRTSANLQTFLIRLADWGRFVITNDTEPFQIGPEKPSHDNSVRGSCGSCCSDETYQNKAYLFGGPDQSIIVGETDVSMECNKTDECGTSSGDPHICTHDGLKYDFQGVGEFVLAKTEDFEVQARHKPYGMFASINSAAAVKIKGDRIAIYAGNPLVLTINGEKSTLASGEMINLPGGAVLRRDDSTIRVSYEDYAFEVSILNERISSLRVHVPPGSKSGGLLGDRNDNRTDDLRLSDGDFLKAPVAFEDLYGLFGKSWRVTPQTSLFDYAEGESTATFTDLLLPWRRTTFKDLSSSARIRAEEVCREAGIVDRINMENCIYDVALTGDESFAIDAAAQRTGGERLEMKVVGPKISKAATADGVTIELPSEGIATYPIEIKVAGNTASQKLTFAPVGSKPDANPGNPYSAAVLKGGTETVTVRVPYRPGAYELRLLDSRGRNIRLSLPFRSIAPEVRIVAEETAAAGGKIDIRVFGDVSPNTKINIVPVGSADSEDNGVRAILKGGIDETATVSRLPKKAGEYEIRYMSHIADNIYARKKLMIR